MTPTARYPEPNVIRFVRRFFPKPGLHGERPYRVLDIGSGSGNHARFFEDEGWSVTALDPDFRCRTHSYVDVRTWLLVRKDEKYDLILDHNTLCHVGEAPYELIHRALSDDGIFLCVHPTNETWPGVGFGKSYTRFASEHELRESLKPFRDVRIWHSSYPDFRDHEISSWVAWGRK
jgi:SAM-dependent methyltransferase